jgi:outer membrane lipoprotein-sorting protein
MRKAVLLFALLMLSVAGSAQTVDEIIAKNIAARGGLAKLKAVKTRRITGTAEFSGVQADLVISVKRPNLVRTEITVQGMTMVQAYDGQNGWQVVPFTGKKDAETMAADDQKSTAQDADIDGALVDYKEKGHKVELVGKEKIEGTDAYHLKVTMKGGDTHDEYLDADSFLDIKSIRKVTRRGTEVVQDTTLGDYKEVEGMMLPFSLEVRAQGMQGPSQKITIQKVEFNTTMDDGQFKMPAPAPAEKTPPADKKPEAGTKPLPR